MCPSYFKRGQLLGFKQNYFGFERRKQYFSMNLNKIVNLAKIPVNSNPAKEMLSQEMHSSFDRRSRLHYILKY